MKYYSEVLNKNFDTVEDLETAEKTENKKVLAKAKEDVACKEEIEVAKKKKNNTKKGSSLNLFFYTFLAATIKYEPIGS